MSIYCLYVQAQTTFQILDYPLKSGFYMPDTIRSPDVVIIHSSYCPGKDSFNLDCVLDLYRKYEVSAHYILNRDGKIFRLVPENAIAFHGGKGRLPDGDVHINTRSIGIELINTKAQGPSEAQYEALNALLEQLRERYSIRYLLGHNEIAPGRKSDPWKFDWKRVTRNQVISR